MKLTLNKHLSKGFSLVEILITTLILGVGLVGTAKFQSNIVQSSSQSKQQVEAVNFAKAKMEEILHFSTAKQFESLIDSGADDVDDVDEHEGESAMYAVKWTVTKTDNSRGANVALKVSWGEDESVFVSTVVSNTTPSLIMLTTQAAPRDPLTDPIFIPTVFPSIDPGNPANGENVCRCNSAGKAVAFNDAYQGKKSNFVRVSDDDGGGMEGHWYDKDGDGSDDDESSSYEAPIVGKTPECDLCCESAEVVASAERAEKYYAQLEAMFMKKVRFGGDQVIGSNGFDPRFLIKGYRSNSIDEDIKKYLSKASDDHDWSSDDGVDDSNQNNYAYKAVCGINYDPAPEPTVDVPNPKPIAKSTRCVYHRKDKD